MTATYDRRPITVSTTRSNRDMTSRSTRSTRHCFRPGRICLWLAAIGIGMALSRGAEAQGYSITDFGTLGASPTTAEYLNQAGVVVGYSYLASGGADAFYWQNGTMTGLGLASNGVAPIAWGINNTSPPQIVGADLSGQFFTGSPFLWQNGTVTWLPSFGISAYAFKINDSGQIVGSVNVGGHDHAALWYNGSVTDLGFLPGGTGSSAADINAYGYIVGYAYAANANAHAVSWNSAGIHDLGTLPTGTYSACYGVMPGENYSFAVGYSDTMISGMDEQHACVFAGGAPEDIGTLGGSTSTAYAVNDYFQIVGNSQRADATFGAFLYTWYGANMYDLNTLIPAGSGWQLETATGVNDQGKILGAGTLNGVSHSFLLTPTYHLKSVTVKPGTVPGSMTASGVVTLDAPAPTDLVIYLSGNGQVAIPTYCILPEGETSQQFVIDTTAVSSSITASISAALYGISKSAPLTIRPIGVKSLAISPSSVKGGAGKVVTGKITLEFPASPKPITVTLSSNNSAVASPMVGSVVVPEGKSAISFGITTNAVAASTVVTFTATANGIAKTAKLTVTP